MSNRLDQRFAELRAEKRAGLITFTMAFDPDEATSLAILEKITQEGADIVELGIPFSDPMADGVAIQEAGQRALAAGASLKKILALVARFRQKNQETPLVLMGYFNPVYRYGTDAFARDAAAAGVDGIILVDLPPEEEAEVVEAFANKLALVRLIAPTTGAQRQPLLLKSAQGFVYYIAVAGVTGGKSASREELAQRVGALKTISPLPVAIGFGIKTPAQAKEAAGIADAVVVGSALVQVIAETKSPSSAAAFVRELAAGMRG